MDGARIAIFVKHLSMGGAQRQMVLLANAFADKGYEVDLITAKGGGPLHKSVGDKVRLIHLNSRRLWYATFHLSSYIKEYKPDVVLSAGWQVNLVSIWSKLVRYRSFRLVVSVRTNITEQSNRTSLWYARVNPMAISLFYPIADSIIVVSQGVLEDLKHISSRSWRMATVVYNPVVDERMMMRSQEELYHPWFQSADDVPVIVAVGRLDAQKNFSLLLRAFRLLSSRVGARLVIVGDGVERKKLQALGRELEISDRIDFVGFKMNPYPYMRRASLFVLSSDFEGIANVLVEALACGCPVVSTDCPSGPREILEDGKWGRLVPVGDAEELAEAMQRSLEDDHDADHLRRRAMDFTVEKSVDQYLEVLLPPAR